MPRTLWPRPFSAPRLRSLPAMRVAVLLGVVALLAAGGCSFADRRLNPANVPLERRAANHTRAATFAQLLPVGRSGDEAVRSVPEIVPDRAGEQSAPLPPDADGCFVGLALSGGGSRSANFSAACMLQLQKLGLLQRVDYISTVSGGSLTGAYYCLSGDEWNPGNVQTKLTHSFAGDLIARTLLMPWNWVAFTATDYDRSDVLADVFQQTLYSRNCRRLTFADLRPDRPRLLINATDLQSGRRFVFCNESFDQLNADLGAYPISYAVTASAAVPVVLHPVTLRDFSTVFKQYRHLIDGGINDNLGITTLVETYGAQLVTAQAQGRPDPYPNGAVFFIIDAHTQYDAQLSEKSDTGIIESLKAAAGLTTTALLNRASSATLADIIVHNSPDTTTAKDLRNQIAELNSTGYLRLTDRTGHPVQVIYLSLAQVNGLGDVPFASFGEHLNSIDTYFNIRPTEAYDLYQAADLLVRERFGSRLHELSHEMDQFIRSPSTRPAAFPAMRGG